MKDFGLLPGAYSFGDLLNHGVYVHGAALLTSECGFALTSKNYHH